MSAFAMGRQRRKERHKEAFIVYGVQIGKMFVAEDCRAIDVVVKAVSIVGKHHRLSR